MEEAYVQIQDMPEVAEFFTIFGFILCSVCVRLRCFCSYYLCYGIKVNLALVYQLFIIIPVLNLFLCLVVYVLCDPL